MVVPKRITNFRREFRGKMHGEAKSGKVSFSEWSSSYNTATGLQGRQIEAARP